VFHAKLGTLEWRLVCVCVSLLWTSTRLDAVSVDSGSYMATKVILKPDHGMMRLRVKRHKAEATLPYRASKDAAGYDICSSVPYELQPGEHHLFATDLSIEVPEGCYGRVAPRSGLAVKKAINVMAGVIDADYRGLLGIVLINHGKEAFDVKIGDRIAQLILERIATPDVEEIEEHTTTERGEGGFGSTGISGPPASADAHAGVSS